MIKDGHAAPLQPVWACGTIRAAGTGICIGNMSRRPPLGGAEGRLCCSVPRHDKETAVTDDNLQDPRRRKVLGGMAGAIGRAAISFGAGGVDAAVN